jgi:glyoxylase-like metal-dependent hydrolase (beta-lactamase superfamily II)
MREFGTEGKQWSPCASTLVAAETEAVLTDTGHIKSDVSALGDMIERTGKRLTTIYITHGHLDHFLGIGQLTSASSRRANPRPSETSKHPLARASGLARGGPDALGRADSLGRADALAVDRQFTGGRRWWRLYGTATTM